MEYSQKNAVYIDLFYRQKIIKCIRLRAVGHSVQTTRRARWRTFNDHFLKSIEQKKTQ